MKGIEQALVTFNPGTPDPPVVNPLSLMHQLNLTPRP